MLLTQERTLLGRCVLMQRTIFASVLMAAALLASPLVRGGEPPWEATVGDIVFQTSGSAQSQAVQEATGSKWSHVGMVIAGENGPQIIEAVQPAQIIPLKEFLAHGKSGSYEVYLQKLIRQRFPEGMPPDVAVSPQDLADSKLVERVAKR